MRAIDIWQALAQQGLVDPESGEPWSYNVVAADIRKMDEELLAETLLSTAVHRARQVSELQEVRREAWRTNDLTVVLQSLRDEAKLLGTTSPEQLDLDVTSNGETVSTARDVIAVLLEMRKEAQIIDGELVRMLE